MHPENYRYYSLDGAGHLRSGQWLEAGSDEDAVEQIVARHSNAMWEIWYAKRLVARQYPKRLLPSGRQGSSRTGPRPRNPSTGPLYWSDRRYCNL